jgi:hypothetical protein
VISTDQGNSNNTGMTMMNRWDLVEEKNKTHLSGPGARMRKISSTIIYSPFVPAVPPAGDLRPPPASLNVITHLYHLL